MKPDVKSHGSPGWLYASRHVVHVVLAVSCVWQNVLAHTAAQGPWPASVPPSSLPPSPAHMHSAE